VNEKPQTSKVYLLLVTSTFTLLSGHHTLRMPVPARDYLFVIRSRSPKMIGGFAESKMRRSYGFATTAGLVSNFEILKCLAKCGSGGSWAVDDYALTRVLC
jgi:hypothetical protein